MIARVSKLVCVICVALGIAQLAPVRADTPVKGQDPYSGLSHVELMIDACSEHREQIGSQLVAQLERGDSTQSQIAAIYMLGIERYPQAVPALAKVIALRDESAPDGDMQNIWGQYPAEGALVLIGVPSTHEMLQILAGKEEEQPRSRAMQVLMRIYGKVIALAIIRERVNVETDTARIKRLRLALTTLEKY